MAQEVLFHDENPFDQKAQEFLDTKRAKHLREKFAPQSFEERFRPLYMTALALSIFANILAVVSSTSFCYAYSYSIVADLPAATTIALVLSVVFLAFVELIQRYLGAQFFKNWFQFGFRKHYRATLTALGVMILVFGGLSIFLCYQGSPEAVRIVKAKPVKTAPELLDLAAIEERYNQAVAQAQADLDQYVKTRRYRGRLSETDLPQYQRLLNERSRLQAEKLTEIGKAQEKNDQAKSKAESDFEDAQAGFENAVATQGTSLGWINIVFVLLLYLCLWFREYYDYRTVIQYAKLAGAPPSPTLPDAVATAGSKSAAAPLIMPPAAPEALPDAHQNGKPTASLVRNPIGFRFPQREQAAPEVLQHIATGVPATDDRYTIEHIDRRSQTPKRYTLQRVENFIRHYERKLAEAIEAEAEEATVSNRQQWLEYWIGRKAELQDKAARPV